MKKTAILTILMFALSVMTAQMLMAQAKPAPANLPRPSQRHRSFQRPIKLGAIYDFAVAATCTPRRSQGH